LCPLLSSVEIGCPFSPFFYFENLKNRRKFSVEREKANDESSDRFREIDSTKEEERKRQCTAVNVCVYI
jgi:hypothetical protein